jgi:hypothetical protein
MAELEVNIEPKPSLPMSSGVAVFDRDAQVHGEPHHSITGPSGDAAGRMPELADILNRTGRRAALRGGDAGTEVLTGRAHVLLAKAAPVRALNGDVELVVWYFTT